MPGLIFLSKIKGRQKFLKKTIVRVEDSFCFPPFHSGNPVMYFVVYRMYDFKGDSLALAIPGIHRSRPLFFSRPFYLAGISEKKLLVPDGIN
jgi:hypothetical protein